MALGCSHWVVENSALTFCTSHMRQTLTFKDSCNPADFRQSLRREEAPFFHCVVVKPSRLTTLLQAQQSLPDNNFFWKAAWTGLHSRQTGPDWSHCEAEKRARTFLWLHWEQALSRTSCRGKWAWSAAWILSWQSKRHGLWSL